MGKKSPKPPDPKETAAAQTATNIGTAIANSYMGNINQVTPDGSLTYSQSGTQKWTDPLDGKVYDIPTWTATQALSQAQQAIKNQNDAAELNLAKLANTQSGRLNSLLASPVDTANLPAWGDPSKINQPAYKTFSNGPELQTSFQNAGNIQSSVGNVDNVQTSLAGSGDVTDRVANAGTIQKQVAAVGDVTRSYGGDFSADRQRVEDALFARMNPQLAQDRAALEQRLANQGLQPGSEAYNRAIDEANRSASDARYGAILNAGQEQYRLAGLARDAATFQNTAQQQAYDQALASGQFANAAQAQHHAQNTGDAQFANQAQQQRFNQTLSGAQFANSAQQQQFAQRVTGAELANAAQQQRFAQNLSGAEFANNARQQMHGNQTSATAANNALQDQAYNAGMTKVNAQNQQRQAQLQEAFAQRNQPINEISALLSGSQVSNPNFMNLQGQQIANTDYAGIVANIYKTQMDGYAARQQSLGGLLNGIAGLLPTSLGLSDDRMKRDKVRHGDISKGLGLWSYRYKDEPSSAPKRFGLMASEVQREVPEAVHRRNGLRYVDYNRALRDL